MTWRSATCVGILAVSWMVAWTGMAAQGSQGTSCVRVAFGTWTPPLDWNGAGHSESAAGVGSRVRALRDSAYSGQASAGGRDEMQWYESNGVRKLLISPAWWPAGVIITFDRDASRGDTLTGQAVALVADARVPSPRASARVMRSGCPS